MSKHVIMGTAGHVDHGKTALIKALTGIDCDTHKEEKERGITINLGFAHLETPAGNSIGVVDVPGHKDFIRTMVAGAYGIDFVLLVIAADSGIMPQTREHLNIIQMLGVTSGLIALTKIDLVDDEMIELAKFEIMEFVEKTSLKDAPIVPVSAFTGQGIADLAAEIDKLIPSVPPKKAGQHFRMYIDRIFNVKGQGIVVTGSVLNGQVKAGQEVFLFPGQGEKVKIKSIERHGKQVDFVQAGDRAALNISGLKQDDFDRGMILSDYELEETNLLDATVSLFDHKVKLGIWNQVIFHTGTFSTIARIHLLDKDALSAGESGVAQIHLDKKSILLNKDRYIFRTSSNDLTLGGGTILDAKPLHHKRRTQRVVEDVSALEKAMTNQANLATLLKLELKKQGRTFPVKDISPRLEIPEKEIVEFIETENSGELLLFTHSGLKYLYDQNYRNLQTERVVNEIAQWHQKNPLDVHGPEIKELAGKTGMTTPVDFALLDQFCKDLLEEKKIRMVEKSLALWNHEVKPDKRTLENLEWLEKTIRNAGMQKSTLSEFESIAKDHNIPKGQLKMLLNFLAGQNKIFFNGEDVIHSSLVNSARKKLLAELAGKPRGINEKEFRLLIDGTKKIVQDLIGIFVAEGVIEKQTFYLMITEKGRAQSA